MAAKNSVVEFEDRSVLLRLSFEWGDGVGLDTLYVEVRAPGLTCDVGVLTYQGDHLGEFFRDLADNWRGWTGVRQWDAVESGMSIEATYEGNRVRLLFVVRRDYDPEAWQIRLPFLIEPGESLARLAKEIVGLLEVGSA